MTAWAAKRFWTDVTVVDEDGGFAVRLDARAVKTPSKAALNVPTRELADAIAIEWRAVDGPVDPNIMPFTRSANAAIDKVATQFNDVAAMLGAYGGSDLLCYRAERPVELILRQADGWDPLLDWADEMLGARLIPTVGIMPIDQSPAALKSIAAPLFAATPFELTALHDLIALSGSLVLGLCVTRRRLSPDDAWNLSRIDENWQAEQWGEDADATQAAEIKRVAFAHAAKLYQMVQIASHG